MNKEETEKALRRGETLSGTIDQEYALNQYGARGKKPLTVTIYYDRECDRTVIDGPHFASTILGLRVPNHVKVHDPKS